MEIIRLHPDLLEPKRGTDGAAGYDLFMPVEGYVFSGSSEKDRLIGLGFAAKVPAGHVALILPRSSTGVKGGVHLGNTVGVIDSDYEGEWKVNIRQHDNNNVEWGAGDRLFQFVVVPIATPELQFVEKFSTASERGAGGFGSTNTAQAPDLKVTAGSLKHAYLPFRDPEADRKFSWKRFLTADLTAQQKGWLDESIEKNVQSTTPAADFEALYVKWFES